jgi:undecaprenyl-diphosphatase
LLSAGVREKKKSVSDTSLFLLINGLAGKIPAVDEFFKGIANDYFALISACMILIWLWFAASDKTQREKNQRGVMAAAMSIGLAAGIMAICAMVFHRPRPFVTLDGNTVNLLFYRPTDSSFPSNFAAIIFAFVVPVLVYNKRFGLGLLALALLGSFGRVFLGVHYPLDVAVGAGIGIITGFLALGVSRLLKPLLDFLLIIFRKMNLT